MRERTRSAKVGMFFFGSSAIIASVVIKSEATDAAFWIAARTTLVWITPDNAKSVYIGDLVPAVIETRGIPRKSVYLRKGRFS